VPADEWLREGSERAAIGRVAVLDAEAVSWPSGENGSTRKSQWAARALKRTMASDDR
jgi:hypothetical protein